jgi:hypothetical protein
MDEGIDQEAFQSEIAEAYALLQGLHERFEGREIPLQVARVERAIRAQLEAARALLG